MAEDQKSAETNGTTTGEFDIPTIGGGNGKRDKKRGFLGLGGNGTQAAGVVVRSGPIGFVFNNLGLFLKLVPVMCTMVMGLAMPAFNNARNKAIYEDAVHRGQLLKSASALPSDEAVAKMRENTNLDNESLIRAKNGNSGMKFGDDAPPPEQADGTAADGKAAMDGGKGDTAAAAASAAGGAKTAEAMNKSAFGKSDFGNSSPFGSGGGSGGSGASSGFGNKIVNYAPESKFNAMKGTKGKLGSGIAGSKGVGVGRDQRTLGVGKRGKGFGQLKMAALYSKKGAASKYQASAALAGKAFDSGTMSADNSVRGVEGAGVGTGGAGMGEGTADQIAANAQAKGIDQPQVQAVPVPKNDSCDGKNKDAMKGVMTGDEYKKLEGKCEAEKKMNDAYLWIAIAAVACIGIAILRTTGNSFLPYTSFLIAAAWVLCAAVIALANIFGIMAASSASEYPSLKGQATGLYVALGMVDITAVISATTGQGTNIAGAALASAGQAGSAMMQGASNKS